MSYTKKLSIGSVGVCAVQIDRDKWGETWAYWFPDGPEKFLLGTFRVHALGPIRTNKTIIIVDGNNGAVEQSESNPMPSSVPIFYDYMEFPFTSVEAEYIIGMAAHTADINVPLFTATNLSLYASTDCWVRLNSPTYVPVRIVAGQYYTVPLQCSRISIVRDVADGILYLLAVGGT